MRQYMAEYRAKRRTRLKELLGGQCVKCGSRDELEFDHVDPATKSFSICAKLHGRWDALLAEIAKCQLLCSPCHAARTAAQSAVEHGGGASGKRHCPCRPCRDKWNSYMRDYKARRRAGGSETGGNTMGS